MLISAALDVLIPAMGDLYLTRAQEKETDTEERAAAIVRRFQAEYVRPVRPACREH